ncbi:chromosomal replication initiator protein DnaA [Baekduia sp. Peel2402]|uniref:chromosomal replication initiator protein DnaA n=1 Tax=Baekduia sp. Peel2402 TaxID=3458296 RepID=UPI00403EA24B
MTLDAAPIWTRLQAELRHRVPESTYDVWLAPLRPGPTEGDRLVVFAPPEVRGWVAQRFAGVLEEAARTVLGANAQIELRDEGEAPTAHAPHHASHAPASRAPARTQSPATSAPQDDPRAALFSDDVSPLNPKFTFEQFVIGDANRFAHAAALAVAENPGNAYNPLFVVGPPGVGKTHLLHSIGNYVRAYGGGLSVRYTTVERFTNEFLEALKTRDVDAFKHRYRRNDVLLIDDVQFLESKVKTEEEFFHTFNALHETGSQLVLTSDRPPRDIEKLDERLRQRFGSGLVVDIREPDPATRLTVLRKRAHHDGIAVDDAVLQLIAERVTGNIRALEAALIRVVAYASLTGRTIDPALADDVLTQLYGRATARAAAGPPTVERIQELVAEAFDITREELLSASRAARVAWPRQVAMYLTREHTHETLPAIGRQFGGRDHSTVLHACKRAADRIGTDPDAYDAVASITARLTEHAV